jgi:hypothetical protein
MTSIFGQRPEGVPAQRVNATLRVATTVPFVHNPWWEAFAFSRRAHSAPDVDGEREPRVTVLS